MRKIIWIGGQKPDTLSEETYKDSVISLAQSVGGEAVEFGTNSYAIIGDEKADEKIRAIRDEMLQAVATS